MSTKHAFVARASLGLSLFALAACGADEGPTGGDDVATGLSALGAGHAHGAVFAPIRFAASCDNSPGDVIRLHGQLSFDDIAVELVAEDAWGAEVQSAIVSAEAVVQLDEMSVAKQPSLGGVGGNPWIYVQLFDGAGLALSDELLLGRCVQGLEEAPLTLTLPVGVDVQVDAGVCALDADGHATVHGSLSLGGLRAKVRLANDLAGTHVAELSSEATLEVLPEGASVTLSDGPTLGRSDEAAASYEISLRLVDEDGESLSNQVSLGTCATLPVSSP